MSKISIDYTQKSLLNANRIRSYLNNKFGKQKVKEFNSLLKGFEDVVTKFPKLYPSSIRRPGYRKAVIHKFTTVFYVLHENKITVLLIQDSREGSIN